MPISDQRDSFGAVSPLKQKRVITVADLTEDFEDGGGCCKQARPGTARLPLLGGRHRSQRGRAGCRGAIINAAGVPVLCRAVRQTGTTVTSFVVGYL